MWIEGRSSVHPVHATATGLTGWIEVPGRAGKAGGAARVGGQVSIAVERLRSGNALVDAETRRRVDARRYPTIDGEVLAATHAPGGGYALRGVISFRGESVEVEGTIQVRALDTGEARAGIAVEGEQRFDVRDWGLEPPRLLTLRVHPDVLVRIRLEAVPASDRDA